MKLVIAHRERLVREALRRSVARSRFELVAQTGDMDALHQECRRQSPQLLLVELEMLGGAAELLPALLNCGASVIALASNSATAGAYEAMGHGALGLIAPPAINDNGDLVGADGLLARMERLVGMTPQASANVQTAAPVEGVRHPPILAIGASTGGPHAVAKVLADLPVDFDATVLIVQHIEGDFSSGLAEWLGGQCRLPVSLATRGAVPEAGKVYVAGPGAHMVLSPSFQLGRQAAQPGELHIPGINALFLSLAQQRNPGAAVILTGMGSDGTAGLSEMKCRGWYTVAQDEDSSVVFGMPRAAAEAGAVQQSLALNAIGPALVRHFRKRGR